MWQDKAVFIGTLILSYGLAFQAYRNFKEKKCAINIRTSLVSGFGVLLICVSMATLKLYWSAVINGIIVLIWILFVTQRSMYSK